MNHQVLALLDVSGCEPEDALLARLPFSRNSTVVRYTKEGGPAVTHSAGVRAPVDWVGLANAVSRVGRAVRAAVLEAQGTRSVEVFVHGMAPLPAFVHLAYDAGTWGVPAAVLQKDPKTLEWANIGCTAIAGQDCPLDVTGLDGGPRDADGAVVLYIATNGAPPPWEKLRAAVRTSGDNLAGIVSIASCDRLALTPENAGAVANQVHDTIRRLGHTYPHARTIFLAVAGPGALAYIVGAALNPTIHNRVRVLNYLGDEGYELALTLPWQSIAPAVQTEPRAVLRRRDVFDRVRAGVEGLTRYLKSEHHEYLPEWMREYASEHRLVDRLSELQLVNDPVGDEFRLSLADGRVELGAGLLQGLSHAPEQNQVVIGQLLCLHELFHLCQDVRSETFYGVGRAGVALEEVDYWADVFAIGTLSSFLIRRGGSERAERAGEVVASVIDASIDGLRAFDTAQHGQRMHDIAERRLRRYLIWYLQASRARSLRQPEDAAALLRDRLVVELAPLVGALNREHDKVVTGGRSRTELFAVIRGQLLRFPRQEGSFHPDALPKAVLNFDGSALKTAMDYVRTRAERTLVPWLLPGTVRGGAI